MEEAVATDAEAREGIEAIVIAHAFMTDKDFRMMTVIRMAGTTGAVGTDGKDIKPVGWDIPKRGDMQKAIAIVHASTEAWAWLRDTLWLMRPDMPEAGGRFTHYEHGDAAAWAEWWTEHRTPEITGLARTPANDWLDMRTEEIARIDRDVRLLRSSLGNTKRDRRPVNRIMSQLSDDASRYARIRAMLAQKVSV